MKRPLLALALLLTASGAAACEAVTAGDITVANAWSRATVGAARPGVLYAEIRNDGPAEDALIGIATPAAAMPMLHETTVTDGVASMPHAMRIPVPAGAIIALAPGGYHGMLTELAAPLAEGETFPLTLTFETAGAVTVSVEVLALGATGPAC